MLFAKLSLGVSFLGILVFEACVSMYKVSQRFCEMWESILESLQIVIAFPEV